MGGSAVVLHRLVELHHVPAPASSAADGVDADVGADSVNPSVEAGVALEVLEAPVGLGEALLRGVFGVLGILQHPICQRVYLSLVALNEQPKGLPVAAAGALYESEVVGRGHAL